jgi:hypothetical protein
LDSTAAVAILHDLTSNKYADQVSANAVLQESMSL